LEAQRTEQSTFASPAFAEAASRLRAEALQRASAQAGRLLRPRWTAFLTILRGVLMPSLISWSAVLSRCQNGFSATC